FTDDGGWSILDKRNNETTTPHFQRCGKKAGGVRVFGGADAAVGTGVGFGFAGCDGLHYGVLPSCGSGRDGGDRFCAAEPSNRYRAAPHWSSDARLVFFGE